MKVFTNIANVIMRFVCNSLPNNKILDRSKFKAHADDKMTVNKNLNFVPGRVENILEKGENAGY